MSGSFKPTNSSDLDTPGLDTLATAATLGEVGNQSGATTCAAPTTRHPRHRPGCSCIVCIQPPSGKGPKHNPACTCNVCMTVKRRFKTLMMRKKKRQSEREEAEANTSNKKIGWSNKEEFEGSNPFRVENDLGADYSRSIIEKLEVNVELTFSFLVSKSTLYSLLFFIKQTTRLNSLDKESPEAKDLLDIIYE